MRAILDILRWRFDIFERYRHCIKCLNKEGMSILEIGAGSCGLKYFGFKNVRATDISGGEEYLDITKPLPCCFPQFDAVVAIDVIEHVAPEKRMSAVNQMCQIARRKVILSAPNGLITYECDKRLEKFLDKKGFYSTHLKQHIEYGVFDIESFIKELRTVSWVKKVEISNGIDIKVHEKIARFLCHRRKTIFLLRNKLLYPIRNLIISHNQGEFPYHKFIEITLS